MTLPRARCLIGVAASLLWGGPALADRLDKEACDGLKAEEAGLITAGVKADMDKGPEFAKSSLPPERMDQIARLIGVQEQLAFRCRAIAAVPVKKKAKPGAKEGAVAAHAAVPEDSEPLAKPGVALETDGAGKPKPPTLGAAASPAEVKPDTDLPRPAKPAVIRLKPPPPGEGPLISDQPISKKKVAPNVKIKKPPPQNTGLFSFD